MQPGFKSVMNVQGVKHNRLQGKVASEFRTYIVFPPYRIFVHAVHSVYAVLQILHRNCTGNIVGKATRI
jgi:hypothetical protein